MKNLVYLALISLSLTACAKPFQPPPPMFKDFLGAGVNEAEVKTQMLRCGYKNVALEVPSTTPNDVARREICMFKAGFKYADGYKGICSLPQGSKIEACRIP
ncbi:MULTISPECIES: hypothetical protein [Polaromonas]|uniref:Lipoprotein n=1 Tax=Polaromonas aquatica TaxID=332657 RepID=A0ABW1TX71_9BURK